MTSPVGGKIKGFVDEDGITYRYDTEKNEYGKMGKLGYIICFYRPKDKINYWIDQNRMFNPDYEEEFL
jgi:hypothetical protein